jgi:hypothetical protein
MKTLIEIEKFLFIALHSASIGQRFTSRALSEGLAGHSYSGHRSTAWTFLLSLIEKL